MSEQGLHSVKAFSISHTALPASRLGGAQGAGAGGHSQTADSK